MGRIYGGGGENCRTFKVTGINKKVADLVTHSRTVNPINGWTISSKLWGRIYGGGGGENCRTFKVTGINKKVADLVTHSRTVNPINSLHRQD